MVQPKVSPKSFRPGDERWARITRYASEHKLSPHLAILLMLDEGYRSLTKPPVLQVKPLPPGPTTWPSGAVVLPEHTEDPGPASTMRLVSVPVFKPHNQGPRPKSGKKR